jgi:hypothetical protein
MQANHTPEGQQQQQSSKANQHQQRSNTQQQQSSKQEKENDKVIQFVELLTTVLRYVREFLKFILRCCLQLLAWVIQSPPLITGPLRLCLFGLMAFYTIGINAEAYVLGLNGAEPFMPKFLIDDNASLANLFTGKTTLLIAGLMMSLTTTAVCTSFWRDISPKKAKSRYDKVKGQTVDPEKPNEIDLVGYRRKKHKRAGMKRVRLVTFAGIAFTAIDVIAAGNTYNPLSGPIKLLWFVVSTCGSELSFALCMDALDDFRDFIAELRVTPKTTVVK